MGEPTSQPTAARLFALVAGGLLVLAGIAGFMYESSFGTGGEIAVDEFAGTFSVNGWRNVLYLLAGALGLGLASRAPRPYALATGGLFLVIAVWGWFEVDHGFGALLDAVPLGNADNWLHLLIGVAGVAAGLSGRADREPSARPPSRRPSAV